MLVAEDISPLKPADIARPLDTQNVFRERDTTYNFSSVADGILRQRMIVSAALLHRSAAPGNAADRIITGIRARSGREIAFFDQQDKALRQTGSIPVVSEAGGFSTWLSDRTFEWPTRRNNQRTAVKDRVETTICLFPSTFNTLGLTVWGLWHELSHIFTTLNHGDWDSSAHTYKEPDSDENRAWLAHMSGLKACAPMTGRDPADNWTRVIRDGGQWVCNCSNRPIPA